MLMQTTEDFGFYQYAPALRTNVLALFFCDLIAENRCTLVMGFNTCPLHVLTFLWLERAAWRTWSCS